MMRWKRDATVVSWHAARYALALGVCGMMAWAQDPAKLTIVLPPLVRIVRAAKPEVSVIPAEQPNFPAEVTHNSHTVTDWGQMVRVTPRTASPITSVQIGWAYALPAGLEFHKSDTFLQKDAGMSNGGWYEADELPIAARADAPYLVLFVEQVTLKSGMVVNADHAKVAAFYKDCCTGANAGKIPGEPVPRWQPNMPGGPLSLDWAPMPGLKPVNFDVVSFRQVKLEQLDQRSPRGREFPDDGDFITYRASTIHDLLMFGYEGARTGTFTISGEPDWVTKDLYDFTAKVAPEDVAAWKKMTLIEKRYMVQRVLVDALKLKVHDDTSDHPVYELTVAKGGPKLMDYHAGDTLQFPTGISRTGKAVGWFGSFNLVGQDVTMADLANTLSTPDGPGRVVIDKTGLTGTYDFSLQVAVGSLPDQVQQAGEDAGAVSLFDGIKQLGLQLVPAKGPIRGMVVDHIERPPEN